jgi:hypothetical protein
MTLDPGFLGRALHGGGDAPSALEGVPVQLTLPPPRLSLAPATRGQWWLQWHARAGEKYDLETAADLPAFGPAGLAGWPRAYTVDTNETFLLALPQSPRGFFRLKVVP